MSFQARHRWVISKLKWVLDIDSEGFVEDSRREEDNIFQLNNLFKAKALDVYFLYQIREAKNDQGEWIQTSKEMSLFATDGRTEPLRGRAVWFLRKANAADLDLGKTSDTSKFWKYRRWGSKQRRGYHVQMLHSNARVESRLGKNNAQQTKDFIWN